VKVGETLKVLFITGAGRSPDYLCDMVLHGLKSLYGDGVVDVGRAWFMYRDDCERRPHELHAFHGRGFSLYGLIASDASVDRTDIQAKIKNGFFDFVIYGSVHRCLDYLDLVIRHYPRNKIVFLDGEDMVTIRPGLSGKGGYFKRENRTRDPAIMPVSFAIPDEHIRPRAKRKSFDFSPLVPMGMSNLHNLQFDNQNDYYDHYADCFYALTWKKGGWDCLRHYEIMAAGAVPFFVDLERCPKRTMVTFPTAICRRGMAIDGVQPPFVANGLWQSGKIDFGKFDKDLYMSIVDSLATYLRRHLTTVALAKHILNEMKTSRPAYVFFSGSLVDLVRRMKQNVDRVVRRR